MNAKKLNDLSEDAEIKTASFFLTFHYMRKITNETAKEKQKFRQSARWKKFRIFMKKDCSGLDFITQKKLLKGFQLHHKDMRIENYKNITDSKRFLCCNKRTHEFIHFIYTYYKDDPEILSRLKIILDDMVKMNTD